MKIFTSLEFWDDLNFDRNQVSVNFRIIYEIYVKYYKIEAWTMDKIYENDMKNVFLVNSVSYCHRKNWARDTKFLSSDQKLTTSAMKHSCMHGTYLKWIL